MLLDASGFGSIEDVALGLRWTPRALAAEVARRAAVLAARGIAPGSIIVIAHSGTARFFADLFATWALGCAAAIVDPALTAREVETLVQFVDPSAVLIDEAPMTARINAPIFRLAAEAASSDPAILEPSDDPERAALILFTSGTTGSPKGVVLSFRALASRVALNRAAIGDAVRARTLVALPTSFGHGLIGNALTPLTSGADIVLHPMGLELASQLGRIIDRFRIGFLSSVPALWRMALKLSDPPAAATLARVHVGSAPLSAELWTRIAAWSGAEVVNCYGITELANWVAGASSRVDGICDGLVGRPWGGRVAVKDHSGGIRNTGEGELLVQSPSLMSGYLRRPDLTQAAMMKDWFCTGDIGRVDERGLVALTGRIKEEINRAGLKVQPAEIDAVIESHPAVAEACVFAIPDAASGEIVGAAVCLDSRETTTVEALRNWCAARLRREAIPERWFVVDKLARNERGKISRDAVRQSLLGDTQ